MLSYIAFSIVINLICLSSANDDLPSYFPKCHVDSPDLNECILKASSEVRKYIIKGIQELDIPPIDPLIVPEIISEQGTNAVNYKIKLTNAKIKGLGGYEFRDLVYDPKTYTLEGTADFKEMSVESEFEIEGKILVAPVNGKGTLKANLVNPSGHLVLNGELVNRNGQDYYNPKDIKASINLGKTTSSFDGTFGDNEQISRATNDLLAEHSDEIISDFVPAVEKVIEALIVRIMSGINKNVPYKKFLPPSE